MKYAKIIKYDTGNWAGINTTIFFSGCHLHCPGCFNKDAQDFDYGMEFDYNTEQLIGEYLGDPHVDGLCILGGEPFDQELKDLTDFVREVRCVFGKPIHIWSGYTFEEIIQDKYKRCLLSYCDTLVDGLFDVSKKDLNLLYRGSSNQRIIDVKASLRCGRAIEIDTHEKHPLL